MGLLGALESFGKAIWDTGKDAVDVVGDVTAIVDGMQAVGEFVERVGDDAGLDKVVEVGEKLAGWAERVGLNRVLRAADSPILDGGQLLIAGMRLTMGVGAPDTGERFGTGGAQFNGAGTTLRSARPSEEWVGDGSSAYSGQNARQNAGVVALAAADHDVHRVIATEAYQVNFHRDQLDDLSDWLADVGLVTFGLGLIPEVGKAAKEAAELAAVMAALGSSSLELYQLSSEAEANSAALQQLVGRYEDVSKSTGLTDGGPQPPRPPVPTSVPTPGVTAEGRPGDHPPDEPPKPPKGGEQAEAPGPMPTPYFSGGGVPNRSGAFGGVDRSGPGQVAANPAAVGRTIPATSVPAVTQAAAPQVPAAAGGVPASLGALPSAAASGIPIGLVNQVVQAAVEKALERAADRDDADDDDEIGEPDEAKEHEPGQEKDEPPEVSDPAPPNSSIAATLDRESSIEPTPAPAQ